MMGSTSGGGQRKGPMRVRYRGRFPGGDYGLGVRSFRLCAARTGKRTARACGGPVLPGGTTAGNPCKGQTVCAGPGELLLVSDAAELRRFSLEDGCFQGIFALMDKAASRDLPAQERTLWAGMPPHGPSGRPAAQPQRLYGGPRAGLGPSVLASLCQLPKERRGAYFLLKLWELLYLLCNRQPAAVAPCANGYYDHYQADAVRTSTTICWRISTST